MLVIIKCVLLINVLPMAVYTILSTVNLCLSGEGTR
jgi:hypothetical protein